MYLDSTIFLNKTFALLLDTKQPRDNYYEPRRSQEAKIIPPGKKLLADNSCSGRRVVFLQRCDYSDCTRSGGWLHICVQMGTPIWT